ncbi:YfjI family protein [Diaphorobacter nitroreducens]|uniref:YfjI family protein n=1 Tax=Diaphorobacter nitroreducens TaxID=164759 RepID=UPI0024E1A345|nr:YfjI family protein [Diaphorobacter nitroreducens]
MNAVADIERATARIDALVERKSPWPDPRPIVSDLPPAPAFDANALLPKPLAEFVNDEADRMCAAPDYVAATLMVALGSVIGTKCAVKPKRRDDWIVTPNLYGGVVGDPSAKKSPTIGTVMRFMDRLEAKEVELLAERQKTYEAELAAFEAHESAIKASMKKAASGKPDRDKMLAAQNDLTQLEKPEEPRPRRFKSNDATVEKLGDILSHNQHGLLVFRDELMGLLASWEKEGREGDKAFYLEGWNGTGSFSIDRIGRGSQFINTLCLSVFGGIQPDLLERYLGGIVNSMDNDGRIQRFQVLVYPEQPTWEWRDRYPVKGAREAVRDLFDRLASFDPVMDGATPADDFVKLPHFIFNDEAQELFIQWDTELNRERIPDEANPMMRQHLGKFEKLFCAVALILHLADGRIGPVTIESAMRAAVWCEYLEGHARRIYGLVETAKTTTAKMLSRRIADGKLEGGFTARDVVRKNWAGIKTTADAETALAILEEHAWIVGMEDANEGGRPTTRYHINPKARAGK